MLKYKRLTATSGITIPKDLRAELGFVPGMSVDLEPMPDGSVRIHKHVPICRFCGSPEVVHFKGIDLCRTCAAELAKEVERHG